MLNVHPPYACSAAKQNQKVRLHHARFLSFVIAMLSVSSCDYIPFKPDPCDFGIDCPPSSEPECTDDSDCPHMECAQSICSNGQCHFDFESLKDTPCEPTPCYLNAQCSDDGQCIDKEERSLLEIGCTEDELANSCLEASCSDIDGTAQCEVNIAANREGRSCGSYAVCEEGECIQTLPSPSPCTTDSDCRSEEICGRALDGESYGCVPDGYCFVDLDEAPVAESQSRCVPDNYFITLPPQEATCLNSRWNYRCSTACGSECNENEEWRSCVDYEGYISYLCDDSTCSWTPVDGRTGCTTKCQNGVCWSF